MRKRRRPWIRQVSVDSDRDASKPKTRAGKPRPSVAGQQTRSRKPACNAAAFEEGRWIVNYHEVTEGKPVDPEGSLYRKGFGFSNKAIREGISDISHLAAAKALFDRALGEITRAGGSAHPPRFKPDTPPVYA